MTSRLSSTIPALQPPTYVVDSVLHGAKMGAKIMAAKTSKQVIDYVDQNPGSIGVIGSNWLNDRRDSTNTTFKKNIHVMRVSIKDKATPYEQLATLSGIPAGWKISVRKNIYTLSWLTLIRHCLGALPTTFPILRDSLSSSRQAYFHTEVTSLLRQLMLNVKKEC